MIILGLETSCDETAAALVKDGVEIISQTTASSEELHKKTGGIVPEVAAREQVRCIIPVIDETLTAASIELGKIDAVAVTYGPGLIGSLLVGVEAAKCLSYMWEKPLVPVNHLVGHIYANFVGSQKLKVPPPPPTSPRFRGSRRLRWAGAGQKLEFPAMCLVVSGGHTELVLMKGHGDLEWVGGTRDDAAGECFDKVARILGLGYPGGPAIARIADSYRHSEPSDSESEESLSSSEISHLRRILRRAAPQNDRVRDFDLPRPLIDSDDYDFSFSGLKTAVLNLTRHPEERGDEGSHQNQEGILRPQPKVGTQNDGTPTDPIVAQLAYEFQEAVTDVLMEKTLKAARDFKVKSIFLSGGVAANQRLREKLGKYARNFAVFIPSVNLCTDNAVATASAAFFNYKPVPWQKVTADPGLRFD